MEGADVDGREVQKLNDGINRHWMTKLKWDNLETS